MKKEKKTIKEEIKESELGKTIYRWLETAISWNSDYMGDIFEEEAFEEITSLLEDFLNQQKEKWQKELLEKKEK